MRRMRRWIDRREEGAGNRDEWRVEEARLTVAQRQCHVVWNSARDEKGEGTCAMRMCSEIGSGLVSEGNASAILTGIQCCIITAVLLVPAVQFFVHLWTNCFIASLRTCGVPLLRPTEPWNTHESSFTTAYTFSTALLERNTFNEYRASWLEALGDLARCRIRHCRMIPAHTRTSSFLTPAAVTNGLRSSPVGSTTSLSHTLSTTRSEKYPAHPDSPTPSVGIVAARLMGGT